MGGELASKTQVFDGSGMLLELSAAPVPNGVLTNLGFWASFGSCTVLLVEPQACGFHRATSIQDLLVTDLANGQLCCDWQSITG